MLIIRQPISRHLAGAERRGSVRMLRIGNLQKPFNWRLRAGGHTHIWTRNRSFEFQRLSEGHKAILG